MRDPLILEKELREWDPEAVWIVTVFNRVKYFEVEVQAGSASLAETMAIGSLSRDGETNLTCTKVERIG